jgi:hypothetical protein
VYLCPYCRWKLGSATSGHCENYLVVGKHIIIELYIESYSLGITYDSSLVRPHSLREPLITELYFVDSLRLALGGKYILLFICLSLGTIRVEILFRAYRPNSNKTQSLYNYLLNHTKQNKQTPWSESASELYRPSDRHLLAK